MMRALTGGLRAQTRNFPCVRLLVAELSPWGNIPGLSVTSEICVMNRHALVLAADSAATVSWWENGRTEERYFKGSNKIFQISNSEPVGIMIYDSADLQRVPWEIIVKTFRSHLGTKSFSSLAEYGKEFFSFIENHRGLFPADYLDDLLIESVDQIMIRFLNMIKDDDRVKAAGDDVVAANQAKEVALQEFLEATIARPLKDRIAAADIEAIRAKHVRYRAAVYLPVCGRKGADIRPDFDWDTRSKARPASPA
jgi:hypothetical protein